MTPPERRATVLMNPAARRVAGRFDSSEILSYLTARGVHGRVVVPGSPAEAVAVARESAAAGDDLLFAIGGDGTVRDAAEGLAGAPTALAAIPGGTVNIWAKETGLPSDPWAAFDAHMTGQVVTADLGRADGHCFLLMAGVGWDADITRKVPPGWKRLLGDAAYILKGVGMLPRLRPAVARWTANGDSHERPLAVMIIGNTRLYGGRVHFTPMAYVDDGMLDVLALCPPGIVDGARLSLKTLAGRLAGDAHVIEHRTHTVHVETPGLPVQIDGDFIGETPMAFSIEPGALRVSVPAGPLPAIFQGQPVLTEKA